MAKVTNDNKQGAPNARPGTGGKSSNQNGNIVQGNQKQSRRTTREAAQRAAKVQKLQELEHERRTRRITLFTILGAVIVGVAVFAGIIWLQHPAPTTANAAYPAVDGVSCDASEQLAYHIHVHLSIYINGTSSPLPQNIGIASDNSCLYWLHTHDTKGVIHIESPTQKNYTLGDFFDEWSGRFSSLGYPPELDSASGWTIWVNVNGKTVNVSNFRNISLTTHTLITMAYNSPNVKPDTTYNWNGL